MASTGCAWTASPCWCRATARSRVRRPIDDGGLYLQRRAHGGFYRLARTDRSNVVIPRRKSVGGIILHIDGGIVVAGGTSPGLRTVTTEVLFSRTDLPRPASGLRLQRHVRRRRRPHLCRSSPAQRCGGMGDSELVMIDKTWCGGSHLPRDRLAQRSATSPDGTGFTTRTLMRGSIAVIDLWDPSGTPSVSRRISTAELPAVRRIGHRCRGWPVGGVLSGRLHRALVAGRHRRRRIRSPATSRSRVLHRPGPVRLIVVTQDKRRPWLGPGPSFAPRVGVSGVPGCPGEYVTRRAELRTTISHQRRLPSQGRSPCWRRRSSGGTHSWSRGPGESREQRRRIPIRTRRWLAPAARTRSVSRSHWHDQGHVRRRLPDRAGAGRPSNARRLTPS